MRLVIIGVGGHGQTVADVAQQPGKYSEILFLDDHSPLTAGKCADLEQFAHSQTGMILAFGNNLGRLSWLNRLELAEIPAAILIHSTAYVSAEATVAAGTVILPKAVINTGCEVRRGCIVNLGAIIVYGCVIEEGVHVCLGAIVKAENRLPKGMKFEAGQTIENRTYPM